jgi:hypothetical protein
MAVLMTVFQAALQAGNLDAIRRVPKSDLHNHFFLGGNRALVSEWAGRDIAPLEHKLSSMAEMHEWVQARLGALFAGAQGRLKAFEATLRPGQTRWRHAPRNWRRRVGDHSIRPRRVQINARVDRGPGARRAGYRMDPPTGALAALSGQRPDTVAFAIPRIGNVSYHRLVWR